MIEQLHKALLAALLASLLFVGVRGLGPFCYGPPYVDPSVVPPNDPACLATPHESSDKGSHSDPYVYRIWAYATAGRLCMCS